MTSIKKLTIGLALMMSMAVAAMVAFPAAADTLPTINFESPYTPGNINGQQGWMKTGPYDVEVEEVSGFSNASGFGFGDQALRLSNSTTSGSFGDQTFTPGLTTPAGEATANKYFEASFDIGSTELNEQPGLFLSVSPDDGNGSRMSYVGFEDLSDGIHVIFYDVTNAGPLPAVSSFNESDVATVNRTSDHNIRFEIELVPGISNDVVRLYVDGTLVKTGTTWENYYRFDPEQTGNSNAVPTISKLLFRAGGTAASATAGKGYLVDNVSLMSDATAPSEENTGEITAPATDGLALSGVYEFEATYEDNDVDVDGVQWAIRMGSCNSGTVLGNVDGHTDTATFDGENFSFSTDVDLLSAGDYCFVFNPTDDAGENDVRLTRTFMIEAITPTPHPDLPLACDPSIEYNVIEGTNGANTLNGTNGADLILGKGGADRIDGKGGADCIVAGDGADRAWGGNGDDTVLGGGGADTLYGDNGEDKIYGEAGADTLRGGNAKDTLVGGNGSDTARGENGNDTCEAESENSCEL